MEKEILKLFLTENKLKFSEIEKYLKVRSNKLDYHLKKLLKKGIITKQKEFYQLSEGSENIIPYLSEKNSTLPVILILIGNKNEAFLQKREKRPYKNLLSLPGGRLLQGEEIETAAKRIMKEKHNVDISLKKINSISLEHLVKNKKIINSFILILITATTKNNIKLTEINKNKSKIIPSDYKLIKKESKNNTIIKTIKSTLKQGD